MSDESPTAIANQALDQAGIAFTLGDIQEGSRAAQVCLRHYRHCLKQLLRAAHWNFARHQAPLLLLADASGQTPSVGTQVPTPWVYEYAYPTDCEKARFIPANPFGQNSYIPTNNAQLPNVPLTSAGAPMVPGARLIPARFLIGTDSNYPAQPGQVWWQTQGVSPQGSTVIMTNVKNAQLVYTRAVLYPNMWDESFRAAMVAMLASEIALPLSADKRFGLQLRAQNIMIVKAKVMEARVNDGNEMGFANTDHNPDWMRIRHGNGNGGWSEGPSTGWLWGGYDGCSFADGTTISASAAF